jgi:transposase
VSRQSGEWWQGFEQQDAQGQLYLRRVLCQAAWAATRAKRTFLAATWRRLRGKIGERKAIVAPAHDMIVIAYPIIAKGESYCQLGENFYDQKRQPQIVARIVKRLLNLGFYTELKPVGLPEMPGIAPGSPRLTV